MNDAAARAAVVGLLDGAMTDAARAAAGAHGGVVTVDIHVAFLHPGARGIAASARVVGGGRSLCFCEAEAADESGRIVARAMGTLRMRHPA